MKQTTDTFQNAAGISIFQQSWRPEATSDDDPVRAVIVLVHGLSEHSGRYLNLVNHLVPRGIAIHALDHQGHGKSGGKRKYIDRFEDYTATLGLYSAQVRADYPDTPVFLLGHSMGGLIAARYLLDHQHEFNGAILSAPAMQLADEISPLLVQVGKMLSVVAPRLGLVPINPKGISRDPEVVRDYLADPLVWKDKTPARLAAEIFSSMNTTLAQAARLNLPMLMLQGSADRIVNPAGTQTLYETISSPDKTLKVYAGLYHEVFNEPEHAQVLTDVMQWLDRQLNQ